jgi:uncharacterized repeat protein (TIGR04138 family)
MAMEWRTAYAAMHRAGDAEFSPACLAYVLTVVRETSFGREVPLTPGEFVTHFRARIRRDFGPLLRETLADWELRTPEDLGRAIALLGKYDCLTLAPTDTVEAFAKDTIPLDADAPA